MVPAPLVKYYCCHQALNGLRTLAARISISSQARLLPLERGSSLWKSKYQPPHIVGPEDCQRPKQKFLSILLKLTILTLADSKDALHFLSSTLGLVSNLNETKKDFGTILRNRPLLD
eukprot:Gregarina_sp_Poly_1__7998@NODE_458_length_8212_cov_59_372376_g373_i0_p5_GENE_NODE_458_length_8212_cov_59_372376_g373_i0NODE_458_length_8212_cov_59_372376_g373_i0_p5_ORF_typecomplete_len117_score13_16_NODE_458_length_8212_cov_59_372376_g373_i057646114